MTRRQFRIGLFFALVVVALFSSTLALFFQGRFSTNDGELAGPCLGRVIRLPDGDRCISESDIIEAPLVFTMSNPNDEVVEVTLFYVGKNRHHAFVGTNGTYSVTLGTLTTYRGVSLIYSDIDVLLRGFTESNVQVLCIRSTIGKLAAVNFHLDLNNQTVDCDDAASHFIERYITPP